MNTMIIKTRGIRFGLVFFCTILVGCAVLPSTQSTKTSESSTNPISTDNTPVNPLIMTDTLTPMPLPQESRIPSSLAPHVLESCASKNINVTDANASLIGWSDDSRYLFISLGPMRQRYDVQTGSLEFVESVPELETSIPDNPVDQIQSMKDIPDYAIAELDDGVVFAEWDWNPQPTPTSWLPDGERPYQDTTYSTYFYSFIRQDTTFIGEVEGDLIKIYSSPVSKIAIIQMRKNPQEIYVWSVDVSNGEIKPLFPGKIGIQTISPGGRWIVLVEDEIRKVYDMQTMKFENLEQVRIADSDAAWWVDEDQIIFLGPSENRERFYQVFGYDFITKQLMVMSDVAIRWSPGHMNSVVLSPDFEKLAYEATTAGAYRPIYVLTMCNSIIQLSP